MVLWWFGVLIILLKNTGFLVQVLIFIFIYYHHSIRWPIRLKNPLKCFHEINFFSDKVHLKKIKFSSNMYTQYHLQYAHLFKIQNQPVQWYMTGWQFPLRIKNIEINYSTIGKISIKYEAGSMGSKGLTHHTTLYHYMPPCVVLQWRSGARTRPAVLPLQRTKLFMSMKLLAFDDLIFQYLLPHRCFRGSRRFRGGIQASTTVRQHS